CSEVSHCSSSPRQLRRGRHTCTSSTSRRFTRRSPAPISHCRSVSLLTSTWWFLARYSQASVGPKSRYFACTSFSVLVRTLSGRRRFDTRPRPRCTTPRSPSFFTRRSSSLTQRSLTPNCCAARCVKCFRFTSCKIFSRSRSFVLNINISCLLIRSVCRFRTGTFYFAGIGTSHFAVTCPDSLLATNFSPVIRWRVSLTPPEVFQMSYKGLSLEGKKALVFGGTSGLGKSIALGFAEAGADVVPVSRRAEEVSKAANEIRALGLRTLELTADVTKREDIQRVIDRMIGELGRIDILVN